MKHRVVINAGDTDVRVAFLEDGHLVEFHREHLDNKSLVGNIYRGVVKDVVPGLQAAFVDVGLPRNVFIHFMDVRTESLVMLADNLDEAMKEASQEVMPGRIRRPGRRDKPDLSAGNVESPLKAGDNIIVQVIKDGIGDKAPRVSTNLALAGRYLVLLPFPSQDGGVSRRVHSGEERQKLRDLLQRLRTDQYSFIVRTAGLEAEEDQILADSARLTEQWRALVETFRNLNGCGLVYTDHEIIDRMVRDAFSPGIGEIVVDDGNMADRMRMALQQHLPELLDRVVEYDEKQPVFDKYGVETQLRRALEKKIWLKSGGYILIEETEALVAIDVNSGRFTGQRDQEKTSLRTNMEACEVIAEQIRLRDLGGILVLDFIDMLSGDNRARVSDEFRHCMRFDRAKSTIGRIGDSGLLTLTRKRKYQSLQKQVFDPCPYCSGEGRVLKLEEVWRRMKNDLLTLLDSPKRYAAAVVCCQPQVAEFLKKDFAEHLDAFMDEHELDVIVRGDLDFHREDYTVAGVEGAKRGAFRLHTRRIEEDDVFAEPIRAEDVIVEQEAPAAKKDPRRAAPAPQPQRDERRGRQPKPQQPAAAPAPKPAVPPPPPGDAADDEAVGEDGRRRTRRGRRGGRRRREREERRQQRLAAEAAGAAGSAQATGALPSAIEAIGESAAPVDDIAVESRSINEETTEIVAAPVPTAPVAAPVSTPSGRPPRPPRPPRRDDAQARPEPGPRPERPERPERAERPPRDDRRHRPAAPPAASAGAGAAKVGGRPLSSVKIVSKYGVLKKEKNVPAVPTTSRPLSDKVQVVSAWGSGVVPKPRPEAVAKPKPKPESAPAPAPVASAAPARSPQIRVLAQWGGGSPSKSTVAPQAPEVAPATSAPVAPAAAKGRRPRPARPDAPVVAAHAEPPVVAETATEHDPAAVPEKPARKPAKKHAALKATEGTKEEKPKAAAAKKPAKKAVAEPRPAAKKPAAEPKPAAKKAAAPKPAAKKSAKKAAKPEPAAAKPKATAKKAAKKK